MSTEPPKGLYEPDLSKAAAKSIIDLTVPALQEIVNFGLNVLTRSMTSTTGKWDLPVFYSYRHLLEMTDAIMIHVGESCEKGAVLSLRSAFEALLTIQYITSEDSQRRGFAWLMADVHRRWSLYRSFDDRTTEGRKTRAAEERDPAGKHAPQIPRELLDEQYARWEDGFRRVGWEDANAEWERCKAKKRGRPRWYELYDGPRTIEQLADVCSRPYQYHLLYRQWAQVAHVEDISGNFHLTSEGIATRRLRSVSELRRVACLAITFGLDGTQMMLQTFRAEEIRDGILKRWYLQSIKPAYDQLRPVPGLRLRHSLDVE